MTANYVLLEKITVGAAGAASVTFSGIPQTGYTDLVLKTSNRTTNAGTWANITSIALNSVTTNQTSKNLLNIDGSAASNSLSSFPYWAQGNGATSNTFSNSEFYIPNYTSSDYKSISLDHIIENNGTAIMQQMSAYLWSSTSAITSITFNGDFLANSTFYLYGVAALGTTPAIVPYATGGDTIMTDGTYWYHTFISSGTFTPQKAISCDYLVVAGGGGSSQGAGASGGGGAGGLRSTVTATGGGGSLESALSLGAQAYTVTIGAGGAGGAPTGGNGSNSTFSTITSTGGGRSGGTNPIQNGASGGSGGGGGEQSGIYGTGGAGTANQGYAGGAAGSATYRMGGGGGAGAVGVAGGSSSGNGGAGVAVSITGSSVTYAGGGGGAAASSAGTGGAGGGGNGGNSGAGVAGTANTGGGGGGSYVALGTAGGSGIVVVRYAV